MMRGLVNKVSRRSRWLWNDLWSPVLPGSYWQGKRGHCIFIYHGLDHVGSREFNTRFISADYFEKQLIFFKKHFHIASLDDYLRGQYPNDRFVIALTFDDGYRNNLEMALPLLEKYRVPATFFVTSIRSAGHDILWSDHLDLGFRYSPEQVDIDGIRFRKTGREFVSLETGQTLKNACKASDFAFKKAMMKAVSSEFRKEERLSVYWQLMNEEELHRLNQSPYARVASHGHLHNNYDNISTAQTMDDLRLSRAYLEDTIQEEVTWLAYPDGSYNQAVIELAEEAGYQRQFAVEYMDPAHESDPRVWPRFGLNPFIKLHHQAKAIVNGKY